MAADSQIPPSPSKGLFGNLKNDASRHPSPQPTHLGSVLQANGHATNGHASSHKVLRSATVGYAAPEFTGKEEQMKQGEPSRSRVAGQLRIC